MTQYYFTEKGYKKLKEDIERLDRVIKRDISEEIATAREHGDLSENAEYDAAKEKQANHMLKLSQLQERFAKATIVRRQDLPPDVVTLGKRVKIRDADSGDEKEYTILGEGELDLDRGIISYQSPMAAALINHKKGESVEVTLPRGKKTFEILEIDFFEDDE
jgi:transcription elongation factor GreA